MLADRGGVLRVAASSSEQVRLLELYELQNEEGPCLECFASGSAVSSDDLEDGDGTRWPRFGSEATAAGFRSVLALPLRLRSETIGALNMFRAGAGPLGTVDRSLAQALADVATIGILQERGSQRREVLARQLQEALTSRVVIEQAKGVIAERLGLHVDEAFDLMRSHARSQNEKLSEVADRVVSRKLDLSAPRVPRRPARRSPRPGYADRWQGRTARPQGHGSLVLTPPRTPVAARRSPREVRDGRLARPRAGPAPARAGRCTGKRP
jgi:hypothetical protein